MVEHSTVVASGNFRNPTPIRRVTVMQATVTTTGILTHNRRQRLLRVLMPDHSE